MEQRWTRGGNSNNRIGSSRLSQQRAQRFREDLQCGVLAPFPEMASTLGHSLTVACGEEKVKLTFGHNV